jgi:hypothetical protein
VGRADVGVLGVVAQRLAGRSSPESTRIIDTLPRYGSITVLKTRATKGPEGLPSGGMVPRSTRSGLWCSTPRTPWAMKSSSRVMPIASVAEAQHRLQRVGADGAEERRLDVSGSRSWSSRYFIIRSSSVSTIASTSRSR